MDSCRPLTVAIAGGSASGKSTIARELADRLSEFRPVILNQDRYFRDWSEYPPEERRGVRTSNHPRAVVWEALESQIRELVMGRPVEEPVPGTSGHARGRAPSRIEPGDVILVEGHLILGREGVRDLMDVKIYVEVDPHERVLRRMLRDTSTGGMTLEEAVAWYRRDVIPNYPAHTEATRRFADLVVPFERANGVAADFVASGLRGMVLARRSGASA